MKMWDVFIYRATVGYSERTVLVEFIVRIDGLMLNVGRVFFFKLRITISFFDVWYPVVLSVIIINNSTTHHWNSVLVILLKYLLT
jgi:hypothetical protein